MLGAQPLELLAVLAVLGGLIWLLVGPVVAWRRAAEAGRQVALLRLELAALRRELHPETPAAVPAEAASEPEPAVAPSPVADAAAEPAEAPVLPPEPEPSPALLPVRRPGLEQRLTQRWLVWLGGLALALGGAFVVKAAVDQGWFGPTARVLLATLLGIALVVAGEWLRRRPGLRGMVAAQASYVPPALAAAGVATLFAAIWGASELYDLLPPGPAFLLLAGVCALAVLLAWQHGPLLAALGFGGAFAVPVLVATGEPAPTALFAYLLAPTVGGVVVLLYKPWWWLGWLVLAGAGCWLLIEMAAVGQAGAPLLFLLAGALAFAGLAHALDRRGPEALPPAARRLLHGAVAVAALLMVMEVIVAAHAPRAVLALLALAALQLATARRVPALEWSALVPATAALVALLAFRIDLVALGLEVTGDAGIALPALVLLADEARPFARWSAAFAALFAFGGFMALWGARRPGLWAGLSAALPLLILALAYFRIEALAPSLPWAALALGLTLLGLAAARRVARFRPTLDGALAAYATGVIGGLSLACTLALEEAWLTVALAAQLPAMGWVWRRLGVPALRAVATLLAAVIVARIALGPDVLATFEGHDPPGWLRLLYAHGLPLAAFLLAARLFAAGARDRLVVLLETGALLFWLLLLFMAVRRAIAAAEDGVLALGLAESGLHASLWLATAWGLLRRARLTPGPVARWGALALGLAAGWLLLFALIEENPVATGDAVGAAPLLNLLFLGYGVPALCCLLLTLELRAQGRGRLAAAAGIAAVALGLAYLGLEVRRAFHGPHLAGGTSSAESWAYSLLLLGYAAALLVAGIWRRNREVRFASLAVLMLGVAKVFLVDLGELEGLYRAASFIALGLSLVAIGLVYQRFVFPPGDAPPAAAPPTGEPPAAAPAPG